MRTVYLKVDFSNLSTFKIRAESIEKHQNIERGSDGGSNQALIAATSQVGKVGSRCGNALRKGQGQTHF